MKIAAPKTSVIIGIIGMLVMTAIAIMYTSYMNSGPDYIDPSDQALVIRGKQLYANNCAACHGTQLEGQPDWRTRLANGRLPAPPHDVTGHTWHHPDTVLISIIKNGLVPGVTAPPGYESDMPAYKDLLPDSDIRAILAYIKSAWPKRALDAQKEVTLQSRQ